MALDKKTRILTAMGFEELGDIEVGDSIIDSDGNNQTVTEVVEGGYVPVLDVTTPGGFVTSCTSDHPWSVTSFDGGTFQPVETGEMFKWLDETPVVIPTFGDSYKYKEEDFDRIWTLHTILADCLKEHKPAKGFLTVTTDDFESLSKIIKTIPHFALTVTTTSEQVRFTYLEEMLHDERYYPLFKSCNLFDGDYEKFTLDEIVLTSPYAARETMVNRLINKKDFDIRRRVERRELFPKLPLDHPGLGKVVSRLVLSLGWTLDANPNRIDSITDPKKVSSVRDLKVSNPNRMYVTENFLPVLGVRNG